ncbi:MAG: hypothetical protein DUD26_06665 [Eubacteriaceae bacterium]|uniref:Type II secretion system protein n=1 Tax=Candidatus Pseudoramibacter fermentans TaxID=2594427 RepID=A0A6L5GP85_9FIRM|nr:hypothetical protein [Candidatus Pseudoramibacter fermentans]RRF92447.1 MAG: hypothetical protein DUD26_06665 [Eubacteriaceae bacterium]
MDSLEIRRGRRSWGPLLMELLMAVLIFALVSAAAVMGFTKARALSTEASRVSWAADRAGDISAVFSRADSVQGFADSLIQAYPKTAAAADSKGRTVLTQAYTAALAPTAQMKKAAVTVTVTVWTKDGTMYGAIVIRDRQRHTKLYRLSCRRYIGG